MHLHPKRDLSWIHSDLGGKEFFFYSVVIWLMWIMLNLIPRPEENIFFIERSSSYFPLVIIFVLYFIIAAWASFLTTLKRLKTLNLHPAWLLLLIVPFVNIAFILYLSFKK